VIVSGLRQVVNPDRQSLIRTDTFAYPPLHSTQPRTQRFRFHRQRTMPLWLPGPTPQTFWFSNRSTDTDTATSSHKKS